MGLLEERKARIGGCMLIWNSSLYRVQAESIVGDFRRVGVLERKRGAGGNGGCRGNETGLMYGPRMADGEEERRGVWDGRGLWGTENMGCFASAGKLSLSY